MRVEEATEEAREREDVVHLVRVVAPAGPEHVHLGRGERRVDLRLGVRHGEDDPRPRHRAQGFQGEELRAGEADEDVRVLHRVGDGAGRRLRVELLHHGAFLAVEVGAAEVHDAVPVAEPEMCDARAVEEPRGRDPSRPRADDDDPELVESDVADRGGVPERGVHDDRGAVLVVVEDRDVEPLPELALDVEAGRRGDVLQVDPAEVRRHAHDRVDDLLGILRRQAERERVDPGELREEHRLAFHDRQRALGADVAEAEHGGTVGDDRHGVAPHREGPCEILVLGDRAADPRDAGGVHEREVVAVADLGAALDLDLPAEVDEERPVGDRAHLDPVDRAERGRELLAGLLALHVDRDVADVGGRRRFDEIDRAEATAAVTDHRRDLREHAGTVGDLEAEHEAVGRTEDGAVRDVQGLHGV